jgi:hypothetical protein
MLGAYAIENGALMFRPRFPPAPGVRTRAVFHLPGAPATETVFAARKVDLSPSTHVAQVYPTTGLLPDNQLKFYVYFSAPMRRGEAWRHIHLLDQTGKPVELPFLEVDQELWDREYIYFHAEMEDSDLYADVTEHDGMTWDNDVFELFFRPDENKPPYYELQVNAAGTMLDIFFQRKGVGFEQAKNDGDFHWKAAVIRRGTLDNRTDRDEGWSVEGRIPWDDFARTGGRPAVGDVWRFALCRYDYGAVGNVTNLAQRLSAEARAEPADRLPRRLVSTLGHSVQLLFDAGPAMLPFARDKQQLAATATRLLGRDRVRVADFIGNPLQGVRAQRQVRWDDLRWPGRRSALVVVSDLGMGNSGGAEAQLHAHEWQRFIDEAHRRGLRSVVLIPYARERWPEAARGFGTALTWDLGTGVQALHKSARRGPP